MYEHENVTTNSHTANCKKNLFSLTVISILAFQLWQVFCPRGDNSPLSDTVTVTVTAELDEVTVTALNEDQPF